MQAVGINVKEGTTLDFDVHSDALNVYSTGITSGDLIINSATINANSNPPASGPMTGSAIIGSNNNIVATNSTLNLSGTVIAERFSPISEHRIHHFTGFAAGSSATIDGCDINIDMTVEKSAEGPFAANINGIRSGSDNPLLITNSSNINIAIDAPEGINASGVYAATSATIDKGSNINANISGIGENVYGVYASDALNITDANIDAVVNGAPYTNPSDGTVYDNTIGVLGHPVSIDFTDDTHHVYAKTNRGAAFMGGNPETLPVDQDIPSYDPTYTPAFTSLKNLATIITPTDAAISGYGFTHNGTQLQPGEAIYSLADTSAPAKEVLIATENSVPSVPDSGAESKKNDSSAVETSLSVIAVAAALSVISLYYYQSKKTRK